MTYLWIGGGLGYKLLLSLCLDMAAGHDTAIVDHQETIYYYV